MRGAWMRGAWMRVEVGDARAGVYLFRRDVFGFAAVALVKRDVGLPFVDDFVRRFVAVVSQNLVDSFRGKRVEITADDHRARELDLRIVLDPLHNLLHFFDNHHQYRNH